MENLKAIIFDFDGTLIDSAPDLAHAANRLMEEIGAPKFEVETIAGFIGNGIPKLVERVMNARNLDMNQHQEFFQRFIALYEEDPTSRTVIFDNVLPSLEALQARNYKIAICTNKAENAARIITRDLNFDPYIDALIGGDTTPYLKPNPAPLEAAAQAMNCRIDEILFVGDSPVDAQTAQNANAKFALYEGGYSHGQIDNIKADFRFSQYPDLVKWFSNPG